MRSGWNGDLFDDSGYVVYERWADAVSLKEHIGLCCACNGPLRALPAVTPSGPGHCIIWYTSVCTACGHELVSPGGRKLAPAMRQWERR